RGAVLTEDFGGHVVRFRMRGHHASALHQDTPRPRRAPEPREDPHTTSKVLTRPPPRRGAPARTRLHAPRPLLRSPRTPPPHLRGARPNARSPGRRPSFRSPGPAAAC